MQNDKLLPCPFRGGEPVVHTVEPHTHILAKFMSDCKGESFIECTNCTCAMSGDTEEEVINGWNTRKPMERIVESLEKELKLSDKEKERCAKENPMQFDNAKGYATGISNALDNVRSGGKE